MQQSGNNRIRTCAIIPAYNEARTIADIVQETKKYVDTIFVVDDDSTDNTAEVARRAGAEVIKHSTNRGIGAALQTGYNTAISNGLDYIVQLDGDAQHNPKYIPEMLAMAQSCDIVIASRFLNKSYRSYPFLRRAGIIFFTFVVNRLTNASITDVTSGYRVYKVKSLKRLSPLPNRHWALEQTTEAAKKGVRIKEVSVEMPVRNNGRSQFSTRIYALYPFRMVWTILKVMLFK